MHAALSRDMHGVGDQCHVAPAEWVTTSVIEQMSNQRPSEQSATSATWQPHVDQQAQHQLLAYAVHSSGASSPRRRLQRVHHGHLMLVA